MATPSNELRAEWAWQAIRTFMHATRTDRCDALADLLCDLMHWADQNDEDFAAALDRGRGHYECETKA